jgi:hypothetical protein
MLARAVGPEDFDEWTWFEIERGRRMKLVDYLAACDWFNEFSRTAARWWSEGFDVLVTPTVARPAPELGIFKTRPGEHVQPDRHHRRADVVDGIGRQTAERGAPREQPAALVRRLTVHQITAHGERRPRQAHFEGPNKVPADVVDRAVIARGHHAAQAQAEAGTLRSRR